MTVIRSIAGIAVLSGVCLLLKKLDSNPGRDLIGTPVAYTNAFPFRNMRAEVLEYGLEDVRGLACDASEQDVFIAEGKRSLLVYSTRSGSIVRSRQVVCSGSPSEVADRRGLAFVEPVLYVVEHGRAQIMLRNFGSTPEALSSTGALDPSVGSSMPLSVVPGIITAPSGVAFSEQMLFVTNDPVPHDSKQPSGALYVCASADCKPQLVSDHLEHPSGVAVASKDGPVYVVEKSADEVAWSIFSKTSDGQWIRSSALGSAPIGGNVVPTFLGIALDGSRSMIFAAGPGGLYIFGRSGRNSGRILFDDPITGVASCDKVVYFVVGHLLCRLKLPDQHSARQLNG